MNALFKFTAPFLAGALAVGSIAPAIALAQDVPSYAQPAQPSYASQEESIHGRIEAVNDPFNITVRDDRGFVDTVALHQGTIINPTGLSLAPGMSVTILGTNAGTSLSANEIDTPYAYSGPYPVPVYIGPGYWYPGFAYGYGPSFSLFFGFGGGGFFERRPFFGHAFFGAVGGRPFFGRGVGFDAHGFAFHSAFNRPGFSRSFAASDRRFTTTSRSFAGGEARGFSRGPAQGFSRPGGEGFSRGGAPGGSFSRGGGVSRGGGGGASHHR